MAPQPLRRLATPMAGLVALFATATSAQTAAFSVGASGTHPTIQAAIDACPATGCSIELTEESYLLTRELWIEGKKNLTLVRSKALESKGVRPRLYTTTDLTQLAGTAANPSDPQRPAGWRLWPNTCATTAGGSKNTTNPYSVTGYLHNGLVVVKASSDVILEGLLLDGIAPTTFLNKGIWSCMYDVLHGNVGLNVYQSLRVTLRASEVRNFFSALYLNGRNTDGQYALPNPDDIAPAQPWGTKPGTSGDHLVENNAFTGNYWVVYDESEWDLASTFRFNKALDNRNTDFAATAKSGEGDNMAGGFLYAKDVVHNPHRIHNNTIWGSPLILAWGFWRAGTQHLFYNNIVGGFDRFAKDALLTAKVRDVRQRLANHNLWMDNNLFEVGTTAAYMVQNQSSGQINDPDACASAKLTAPCYVIWDAPVPVTVGIANMWLWNGWQVQAGAPYTGLYKGVQYTAGSSQNIEIFPGGGTIAKASGLGTTSLDISAAGNRWVKTLPFVSLEPGTDGFLVPDWTSDLVKATVKGQARPASGSATSLDIGAATFSGQTPRIHGLKSQRLPSRLANGCWLLPIQTDPEMASGRITSISAWTVPYADGNPTAAVSRAVAAIPDSSLVDGSSLRVCANTGSVVDADIRFQLETSAILKDGTPVAQEPAFYQLSAEAKITVPVDRRATLPRFAPTLHRSPLGLELTGLDAGPAGVVLSTLDGRVVRTLDVSPIAGSVTLPRRGLPTGTLLLQVRQGDQRWQILTSFL